MRTNPAGTLADPAYRRERATNAANARTSIDYHLSKLVQAAARLTDDQRGRLADLLRADEVTR